MVAVVEEGAEVAGDQRCGDQRREDKLIDEKEIQEKIRETQANLAGAGGRGKSLKAKIRREKRQEVAEPGDTPMIINYR